MELLEREEQLAALDAALVAVRRTGRGRLVLVAGEAGAGKSALAQSFADRSRGQRFLWGACDPLFTPRPLGPLLDIAVDIGGELAELCERGAPASDVTAALQRAVRRPLVIVLEDLHWADAATLDVLRLLGRRIVRTPALALATYRDDEVARDHPLRVVLGDLREATRISLPPLSPAAVEAMAAPQGADGARLHARTGGNPFFVTEVLARGPSGTPGTVRDAVLARAARLPPAARRLLEAVAVARPRAEIGLLERLAPAELAQLDRCLASGMLRAEPSAVAFRHEIARAAIEQAMPPDRRVALHRTVLAALEAGAEPARLAHHAEAAGDGAAVLRHAAAAGDRAARFGAHREAAAHFAAALRHSQALPAAERASLLERRSFACFMAARVDEAREAAVAALGEHQRAGDRLREGAAHRTLSRLAWYLGDGEAFRRHAQIAVDVLEALPPSRELALACAGRAAPAMFDFDLPQTREWAGRALALAEELGERQVGLTARLNVGTVELSHGLAAGLERLEQCLVQARAESLHDLAGVAYSNLVSSALFAGDHATAQRYVEEGIGFCEEHDLTSWGTYLIGWSARVALDHGRWDDAADLARQVDGRTRGGLPQSRFTALVVTGTLHARRGDGDAWQWLDEAHAIATATGELQRLGPVAAARAEARWLAGEVDRVEAEIRRALDRATAVGHGWTRGELSLWRHRAGVPTDAGGLPLPFALEIAGDHAAAAAQWAQRGRVYEAAVASGLAGGEDALPTLRGLGAQPAAALVARVLRERGARRVTIGPRASTRANPAGLTRRQMEVLALLVRGDRNADIAAKLFLSEKTVDHHVSAILGKLGVRTRGQAAARAAELGIGGK